jgi:hypothetical protein
MTELAAFASYRTQLGGRAERNNGEAAVLAWISINGGTAVIDEDVARNIGQDDGLAVHGSLWLLARSFNDGILDRATTEGTISDLLTTGMRLPCKKGTDFIPWAQSVGLIPQKLAACSWDTDPAAETTPATAQAEDYPGRNNPSRA